MFRYGEFMVFFWQQGGDAADVEAQPSQAATHQIIPHQNVVSCLQGNICAGRKCDAQVRLRQSRRVIHTIPHHGYQVLAPAL